jgi:hypothetical protein
MFKMENHNENNFNNFLESGIKNSLNDNISERFTERLLNEIRLFEKFEKEDSKTDKFVKRIILGSVTFLLSALIAISYVLIKKQSESFVSKYQFVEDISSFLELYIQKFLNIFGLSLSTESFILTILTILFLFAIFISDKFYIKKTRI